MASNVSVQEGRDAKGSGADQGIGAILEAFHAKRPDVDDSLIVLAYRFAEEAHRGQVRLSGDPFISHPVAVARIVAEMGVDDVGIAAALLHDTVEDTATKVEDIARVFGPRVASLVESLTKLERINFDSKEAQQAATMRKLLMAMTHDWRVLVVKLADRLHNMRTAGALPEWKRQRMAQETLDIYAPLAHRLGIQQIRWQLEDLSFEILKPGPYREISELVERRAPERDEYLKGVLQALDNLLEEGGVVAEVTGRPKHHWSIYEKMVLKGKEFNEIYDLVGVRIIVDSLKDCWEAVGLVHGLWRPVQGRFKDYINSPKFNMYQSIHTTVIGPGGKALEVQVRTREMHRTAEFGVAAHWGYKESSTPAEISWLQQIVDWQADMPDEIEFLESLKLDLKRDEVYVFTPKGKVVALPQGSTPIDFAYAIHTDVGHRCIGAKVNERLVPLDTALHSGDTVEVLTSKSETSGPSRDWLAIVKSTRARNKIRQWFSRERREDAIDSGREELAKALRREGLPVQKLAASEAMARVASDLGLGSLEALYVAIGEGHISPRSVVQRLERDMAGEEAHPEEAAPVRPRSASRTNGSGVYVEGLGEMMVRLSRCCTPVPGDSIVGFVTRGRGVSVHRTDCANALALTAADGERMVDVEWDRSKSGAFRTTLEVRSLDRAALLTDVARVISENHLNIVASRSRAGPDRVSRMSFEVEVAEAAHLEAVIRALKRLDCVYEAYRVLPGGAPNR
jgi:guanosine-3',5'-bis(diphosphate) 3'-pyrophosphohydrolase